MLPPIPACFSFTTNRDRCYRYSFTIAGLRSHTITLDSTTTLHFWIPKTPDRAKPSVLLIHGFGANATWQWNDHLRPLLLSGFNVYIPDLLFFGASRSKSPDRSEIFQAECIVKAMDTMNVDRMSLVGISYGGFVGFRIAVLFPERVDKVVLCCSGVCLEEKDLSEGLFVVDRVEEAASILLPQTPEKLRQLVRLSFVKPPTILPSFFLSDYIHVMCTDYVTEKTELLHALIQGKKLADLPKITQPTLIIWGEQDKIFPLELGHRLHKHLEGNSQLVVIKNAGHAVNLEKPREFCNYLKAFLLDSTINFSTNPKGGIAPSPSNSKFGRVIKSLSFGEYDMMQFMRPHRPADKKDLTSPLPER